MTPTQLTPTAPWWRLSEALATVRLDLRQTGRRVLTAVLQALARARTRGCELVATWTDLAVLAGCSAETVRRGIRQLEAAGIVTVVVRGGFYARAARPTRLSVDRDAVHALIDPGRAVAAVERAARSAAARARAATLPGRGTTTPKPAASSLAAAAVKASRARLARANHTAVITPQIEVPLPPTGGVAPAAAPAADGWAARVAALIRPTRTTRIRATAHPAAPPGGA